MTAEQIILAIQALPLDEQATVIRFARRLDTERQLTGRELSGLAESMVHSTDPVETSALREEIVRGFYGGPPHA